MLLQIFSYPDVFFITIHVSEEKSLIEITTFYKYDSYRNQFFFNIVFVFSIKNNFKCATI